MFTKKQNQGFTLIELLVVVAIIALLSSIVVASLNVAREKARDARRMADMHELNNAIQMYIADKGYAPDLGCGFEPVEQCKTSEIVDWDGLQNALVPKYIAKLPTDPCGIACYGGTADSTYAYNYYATAYVKSHFSLENITSDSYSISCNLEGGEPFAIGFGSI